jgi:hypothetical protein
VTGFRLQLEIASVHGLGPFACMYIALGGPARGKRYPQQEATSHDLLTSAFLLQMSDQSAVHIKVSPVLFPINPRHLTAL